MFRHLVLLSSCLLCCVWSIAQNPGEEPSGLALNNAALNSKKISDAPAGPVDGRISIRRLKVSHKARQLYERALDAWGRNARIEAQKKVDEALRLDPTFPEALTLLGGIQAADHQWNSAEESLQAAIGSDPSFSPAYAILAGVYNTQERYDEAWAAAEHALQADTAAWTAQYEVARAMIGKHQYQSALAISDAALRANHGSLMHLAKAHAMLGLQKYPEAAAELRTYLHDDPAGEGSQNARDLLERLQSVGSR